MSIPAHPRVAFLGPPGTFTEEALFTQPDLAAGSHIPIRSIGEVITAVERGEADLAVVPIENAIEGSVNVTLDTLGFESEDLRIQREIVLNVSMNLCARPGTSLGAVSTVVSIPVATAQCRDWLSAKLPAAAIVAANATAEAASQVAKSKKPGLAAICNGLAARLYGLEILAADIEDHPENQTRFVVLGRGIPARTGHDKTTVVIFQSKDRPGSLLGILSEFAARAVNLTKLESRPAKRGLGHYCFFIDCEGHIADEPLAETLRTLRAVHDVRFLGSYPAAGSGAPEARRRAGRAWRSAAEWVDGLRAEIGTGTAL